MFSSKAHGCGIVFGILGVMLMGAPGGIADVTRIQPSFTVSLVITAAHDEGRLIFSNDSDWPSTYTGDLGSLARGRFLGFPLNGAIQLRDRSANLLEMKGASGGWFYPSILNSVIDQPVFSIAGKPVASTTPAPPKGTSFGAREVKTILFKWRDVLDLSKRFVVEGIPAQFRLKLRLSPASGSDCVFVTSEWTDVP